MSFKFLHVADVHLDSPLKGLALRSEDRAVEIRGASRRAFTNLVETAVEQGVAFLVIAGDLFDGDWKDMKTGLFFAEQMGVLARSGIKAFVVYGNHDAETVIRRRLPWPDNVTEFSPKRPQTIEIKDLKVALHGQSFPRPDVTENIALGYPPPKPGWFNLGLLHTACDGREGHQPYAPCTVDQLIAHGYDYWALGHVHNREILSENPHIVFPGNLQGRHIRETGAKGATLVSVDDGRVTGADHIVLDAARWALITLDLTGTANKQDLLVMLGKALTDEVAAAGDRPLAVRVELGGTSPLGAQLAADPAGLWHDVEAAALGISDTIWIERVKHTTTDPTETKLAGRSDVLGELVQLVGELTEDPEVRSRIAAEIRTLSTRVPKSGADDLDLPDEESLEDVLTAGRDLVVGKLQMAGETD